MKSNLAKKSTVSKRGRGRPKGQTKIRTSIYISDECFKLLMKFAGAHETNISGAIEQLVVYNYYC